MKKIKLLLCSLLLSVSLTGCNNNTGDQITIADRPFIIVSKADMRLGEYYLLVDKETRVQYLMNSSSYTSGITVLVDADGKPILYEGDVE